jgi:hypothetical protein
MVKFAYKGFSSSYEIKKVSDQLYAADGEVYRANESPSTAIKFHTEQLTQQKAQEDIINLIERYVDFEWDQSLKEE